MADITYCIARDCPFKKCERHPSKIRKATKNGTGYVSIANYTGVCRKYITHILNEVERGAE